MIPLAFAQPPSISYAKPGSRFYNATLDPIYKSCPLPTKIPHAAVHMLCSSSYVKSTVIKITWKQVLMTGQYALALGILHIIAFCDARFRAIGSGRGRRHQQQQAP